MPYIVYFSYTIIIIHTKRKGYLLAEILWYIDPNEIIILYRKIDQLIFCIIKLTASLIISLHSDNHVADRL